MGVSYVIVLITKLRRKKMSQNSFKIWGIKQRIHSDNNNEIDLLQLKKNSFCSVHFHKEKINKFVLISGKVEIISELGTKILAINESFEVHPELTHQFKALEDSIMIEIAYTVGSNISPKDIIRKIEGGLIIDGVEMSIPELKKMGLLNL